MMRLPLFAVLVVAVVLSAPAAGQETGAPQVPARQPDNDPRGELQAAVAEMSRLVAAGKRAEALAVAEAIERRLSARLGREHPLVRAALYNLGMAYRSVARPQDAAEAFAAALAIEAKVGTSASEGFRRVAKELARLERDRGQPAHAAEIYKAAIEALPALPEAGLAEAEYREEYGQLLRHLGNYPEAEDMLRRALAAREKMLGPQHASLANTLNLLGGITRVRGKHADAEAFYKRSIEIAAAAKGGKDANTGILIDNLAVLYQQTGRLTEAEALQGRAIAIFEEALGYDHVTTAQAIANLAANYQSQQRFGESLKLYERALDVFLKKLPENDPRLGFAFDNTAGVLRELGRMEAALKFYERALATLQKSYPADHPEVGVALNNIAVVHVALKKYREAETFALRSLKIAETAHGDQHPGVAISLGNLADAYVGQGKRAEARSALERAIRLVEATQGVEHPALIVPLQQLGGVLTADGEMEAALAIWRRAVAIEGKARQRERSLRRDGHERGRVRGEPLPGLMDALWRRQSAGGAGGVEIARESFARAQEASLSLAGAAISQLGARLGASSPELAALVRERQDLARAWSDTDKALGVAIARRAGDRNSAAEAGLRSALAEIDARLVAIDARLAADFAGFQELSQPRPLPAAEAAALLGPDEALIAYHVDAEHVYGWAVSKDTLVWHRLGIPAEELHAKVQALRCGLDDGEWGEEKRAARCKALLGRGPEQGLLPFDAATAVALYKALIEPFAAQIAGKQVLVAAAGPLTSLPFGVLIREAVPDGDLRGAAWLGAASALTALPNVASLRSLRKEVRQSQARKPYFGMGNPVLMGVGGDATLAFAAQSCFAPRPKLKAVAHKAAAPGLAATYLRSGIANVAEIRQLSPLPETRDEICAVAQKVGGKEGDVALGSRASEKLLREMSAAGALADYRVLHFATHGLVAGEITGLAEPALVLTPPAEATLENDGLLTASEVAALKLDADWVIMSACNTAAGEKLGAEALSGLARSFFYAGARALLVSHWPVQSSAAVKLTTTALAEMQRDAGVGRAEALRRAMRALMADKAEAGNWHPQVWAPFAVVGEGSARRAAGDGQAAGGAASATEVPAPNPAEASPAAGAMVAPVTPSPPRTPVTARVKGGTSKSGGAPKATVTDAGAPPAKEVLPWSKQKTAGKAKAAAPRAKAGGAADPPSNPFNN